jgi:hypothetical protein
VILVRAERAARVAHAAQALDRAALAEAAA